MTPSGATGNGGAANGPARKPGRPQRAEACPDKPMREAGLLVQGQPLDSPLHVAIGRAVRAYRGRHELKGVDLAKAAGISLAMLSRIENGSVSPSLGTLQALAGAIGVPVTALFGRYNEHSKAVFLRPAAQDGTGGKGGPAASMPAPFMAETSNLVPFGQDAWVLTLGDGHGVPDMFACRGLFFAHCLAGRFTYVHEAASYDMAPGDSLTFEASGAHGIAHVARAPARLLLLRTHSANAHRDATEAQAARTGRLRLGGG